MDKTLKQHQPPMTIDEQVNNLKALGLIIDNEKEVASFLNDVSYFRLIKGFSIGLKPVNGNYYDGVSFDEIKELYLFNCNFRQSLFSQIEKIEVNLRSRISNHFSCKYGNFGHEDALNFKNPEYHNSFLDDMQSELKRNSKSPFVRNFQQNYTGGKLPLYASIELFSFGTLSKFYKNIKNEDKKAIASTYNVGYAYLESWVEHIAFVRNICAHYGRVYNVNFVKTPTLYKEYNKAGICNNRVFATLLCLKHLLPSDRHWEDFVDTTALMFEKYPHVKKELMGFPENWATILLK